MDITAGGQLPIFKKDEKFVFPRIPRAIHFFREEKTGSVNLVVAGTSNEVSSKRGRSQTQISSQNSPLNFMTIYDAVLGIKRI